MQTTTYRQPINGFTLIEVMIVVAIVAILMAVAFPSYTDHIRKGNRSIARGHLLDIASRQQEFFLNNKTYATNLTALGFAANSVGVNKKGGFVAASAADSMYDFTVTAADASSYSLSATPRNSQASDSDCGTFTLNSSGTKGAAGTQCWN